jgi:hypothetical protein
VYFWRQIDKKNKKKWKFVFKNIYLHLYKNKASLLIIYTENKSGPDNAKEWRESKLNTNKTYIKTMHRFS